MDIEEVAAKDPKAILKEAIDPAVGFQAFQARKLAFGLGLPAAELVAKAVPFMQALYQAFEATDASLARDQPVPDDRRTATLLALDAKVNFDDNALYRHPELKRAARPRRGGPARGRGRRSSASTTSSSRAATSAAW